jgi:hypothetical protein
MTAAYLIMAHRDPPMFRRLVAALPEDVSIVAHIDARADAEPFKMGCPSVTFVEPRLSPNWASWGLVEVPIRLLEVALANPNVTRCTFISGQCYPIVSAAALAVWQNEPVDRLEIAPAPNADRGRPAWRFNRHWRRRGFRNPHSLVAKAAHVATRRLGPRRDPAVALGGRALYAGGTWWSFTRSTAEYALDVAHNNDVMRRYFSHVFAPDESFWQTAVAPRLDFARIGCEPTYCKWEGGPHPAPLTSEDLIREASNGRFAFARKFSSNEHELLDLVDRLRQTQPS